MDKRIFAPKDCMPLFEVMVLCAQTANDAQVAFDYFQPSSKLIEYKTLISKNKAADLRALFLICESPARQTTGSRVFLCPDMQYQAAERVAGRVDGLFEQSATRKHTWKRRDA